MNNITNRYWKRINILTPMRNKDVKQNKMKESKEELRNYFGCALFGRTKREKKTTTTTTTTTTTLLKDICSYMHRQTAALMHK
jgi:hypothetical protein